VERQSELLIELDSRNPAQSGAGCLGATISSHPAGPIFADSSENEAIISIDCASEAVGSMIPAILQWLKPPEINRSSHSVSSFISCERGQIARAVPPFCRWGDSRKLQRMLCWKPDLHRQSWWSYLRKWLPYRLLKSIRGEQKREPAQKESKHRGISRDKAGENFFEETITVSKITTY
jgi:hypothetical protein